MSFPLYQERNWVTKETLKVPPGFLHAAAYPEIVIQTLLRRGISTQSQAEQFLDPGIYIPTTPYALPEMETGIERILRAVKLGQRIGVWGDFDVDGQTSTAILVSALRQINADVVYHIPVRGVETHGIGVESLKIFLNKGVDVLLTCDTGTSATEGISYAQSAGIDVVVTDHHLLPEELPPAFALINPRRLPSSHPLASLPGAGTAFKFAEALLSAHGNNTFHASLYDLAALGCVADLAELIGETRFMVQSGLHLMRTAPRPALAAMLASAEINHEQVSEAHISFNLAPRLNAIGRLADANPMVEFLLTTDAVKIATTVNQIEGLNLQRKTLSDQVFNGAVAMVERNRSLLDHPILILHHPEWPGGIVGIAASRLVEFFHRPVILLVAPPGMPARGSARSFEGFDITAAISANQNLLLSFGGHPMAAGLSLLPENIDQFQRAMDKTYQTMTIEQKPKADLFIDGWVNCASLTLDFVHSLDVLAPFGQGNPPLLFAEKDLQISKATPVGKLAEHTLIDVEDLDGSTTQIIRWNSKGLPLPEGRFNLAFSVHASNYRGEEKVQFEWVDYALPESAPVIEITSRKSKVIHSDFRLSTAPLADLKEIQTAHQAILWKEGFDETSVTGVDRFSVSKSPALILWSSPPELSVLQHLLKAAKPSQVFWFLIPPQQHQIREFLRSLDGSLAAGLKQGQQEFSLSKLAAATATTERICLLGIQWLTSSGRVRIIEHNQSNLLLDQHGIVDVRLQTAAQNDLKRAFQEIRSFTQYLKRVDLEFLALGLD